MNNRNRIVFILFVIPVVLLCQCGLLFNTSSVVEISLGAASLPPGGGDSFKPPAVTGGTLRVDIPGSDPILKDFGANDDSIKMVVPSGHDRLIELEINLDDTAANTGPVLSYIGTAIVDLVPNETKRVHLKMIPGRTRLLVPDQLGGKVAQMGSIDDPVSAYLKLDQSALNKLPGSDWPTYNPNSPFFFPTDIDFDARGAIYIANYPTGAPAYNRIIRLRTIQGDGFLQFPQTGGFAGPVQSLAVDKMNNLLYFYSRVPASPNLISRIDLTAVNAGSAPLVEQIDLTGDTLLGGAITQMRGMDSDRNGILYIACNYRTPSYIYKIDFDRPAGSRILAVNSDVNVIDTAFDVIVKGDYVYVSNNGGTSANRIIMLRKSDLSYVRSGAIAGQSGAGDISGPSRFFAVTAKKFYLADDSPSNPITNHLVEFFDLDWNGWLKTHPVDGQFLDYFQFFN